MFEDCRRPSSVCFNPDKIDELTLQVAWPSRENIFGAAARDDHQQEIADQAQGILVSIDGAPYLVIGNTPVRCYPFPPEEQGIAARRLILKNSLRELLAALNNDYSESPEQLTEDLEQACARYQRAGEAFDRYLESRGNGSAKLVRRNLYGVADDLLANAFNSSRDKRFPIMGLDAAVCCGALSNLTVGIRELADMDSTICEIITKWYKRVAQVKGAIVASVRKVYSASDDIHSNDWRANQLLELGAQGCALVDARLDSPEYNEAQQQVESLFTRLRYSARDIQAQAARIRFMALTRQELRR